MAKGNKKSKSKNNVVKDVTPSESIGGLKAGLSAVKNAMSPSDKDASGPIADELRKAQAYLDAAGEEVRKQAESSLQESLQNLAGLLKTEISKAEEEKRSFQSRSNKLLQSEESVTAKREELDGVKKSLEKDRKQIVTEKKELATNQADIADQRRDLEDRLLDAEAGFSEKNSELLEKYTAFKESESQRLEDQKRQLLADIEALKAEKIDVKASVESESASILEALRIKKDDLDTREDDLTGQLDNLGRQQRRLSKQQSSLEDSRIEMQEEIRSDFLRDLERAKASEVSLQAQIAQYADDEQAYKKQLMDFSTLKSQLGDEGPSGLLSRLKSLQERNDGLLQELSLKPSADLEERCKTLRDENQELQSQLDSRISEVSRMKSQVSQSRVAVIERETLAKEKLVLEKSNELLGGRIESLRDEVDDLLSKQQSKTAFPALLDMDNSENHNATASTESVTNLEIFAGEMQQRIAWDPKAEKELFFRIEDIRLFIAGLSMSRLHVLQGISGTGKTSLAQAFARAVGGGCETVSVQAGWRDKDDLIGHYNSFEKQFYERPCLQGLYEAQTPFYKDRPYIVLLDEMNLSRPEQYFAEFLSALELDHRKQLLALMTSSHSGSPRGFQEGRKLQIPSNVWFVGTANHDETTFEFADKTYDRAHVMELPRNEERFTVNKSLANTSYSFSSLEAAFENAQNKYKSDVDEILLVLNTSGFVETLSDKIGVSWGNRLERQARRFVSTMMASGGTAEAAMDHLLATKVLRHGKATGRYDTEREDIEALQSDLQSLWGDFGFAGEAEACNKLLSDELRRKSSH